jgi:hypothetical protein
MGLSGPEGGIGTDDGSYFAGITSGQHVYVSRTLSDRPFSVFLKFLYPFSIIRPLNIIIPNLLGIAFLPYFTHKFSFILFNNSEISLISRRLISFCPFTMAMGLILIRDIWIVTFIIAGLYFFQKNKFVGLGICVLLVGYIRFGSLVFLGTGLIVLSKSKLNNIVGKQISNIIFSMSLIGIVFLFYAILPFLVEYSDGRLQETIVREKFAIDYLQKNFEDSTIAKLTQLPYIIKIPALSIFFFFCPFLKFKAYTEGIFNIRTVMSTLLTPLLLFFSWKYIMKSLIAGIFNKSEIRVFVLLAIIISICLAVFSMQVRHKTILMPFLYILTAYGYCMSEKNYNVIAMLFTFAIIAVQIYMLL